jgi:thiol-disulfide isomerase/thioredoxin
MTATGATRHPMPPLRMFAAALVLVAGVVSTANADVARVLPWTGPTPPFALKDLAGKPHALADYRDRVVLVNFWATWCEPCLDEMPSMQRLQQRMAGQPFTILAVNYGEAPARIEPFLGRVGVGFPVLLDQGQQMARAWRVRILPASFLVGRDGQARYHVIGEIDWTSAEAVAAVQRLLAPAGAGTPGRR